MNIILVIIFSLIFIYLGLFSLYTVDKIKEIKRQIYFLQGENNFNNKVRKVHSNVISGIKTKVEDIETNVNLLNINRHEKEHKDSEEAEEENVESEY